MAEPVERDMTLVAAEIARLNKIITVLMDRAERNTVLHGSDFNLFQTAIILEEQVHQRTADLEKARQENEKVTRALRESENRHRLLIENAPVSIHEIDMEGRVTSMSRAGLIMRGANGENEVRGSNYLDIVDTADRERIEELLARAYAGETSHFEFRACGPEEKVFKSCFVPLKNKNGRVEKLMGITEDITEQKKAEEQIRRLAFYDPLTQLPNRRLLMDRLGQAMSASKRSGSFGAVIFLDLDRFKALNDTHGHETGDLLLIEVAQRISNCLREMDTVARFGGDEFVVMLGALDVDKERAVEKAGIVAEKIRAALARPYFLTQKRVEDAETVEHHCTSSSGIALFASQDVSAEEIFKRADLAMYQAKAEGRNVVRFFE